MQKINATFLSLGLVYLTKYDSIHMQKSLEIWKQILHICF